MARRGGGERRDGQPDRDRDRDRGRDGQPDRDRDRDQYHEADIGEPERESVAALKAILTKVATVVKPLGLTPEESTDLVQRMYESILELDTRLAEEIRRPTPQPHGRPRAECRGTARRRRAGGRLPRLDAQRAHRDPPYRADAVPAGSA